MKDFFNILTVVSSIIMIIFVLAQSRGSSLGSAFGGDNVFYTSRRGVDLVIYQLTIIFSVIFVLSIILGLLAG